MKTTNCRITINPTTGAIFTQQLMEDNKTPKLDKNGEPFGFIRIEQTKFDLSFAYQNGGIRNTSALKAIKLEAWEKAKQHYTPNMEVGGKILVTETIDPTIHKEGIGTGYQLKRAGKGTDGELGEILTINGTPIYRRTEHVENVELADTLIKHDNVLNIAKTAIDPKAKATLNAK